MSGEADEQLACGRSSDELLEQVFAGDADHLDAHQLGCGDCRAVLAEADGLWAPLRTSGRRLETPPAGLRASVLRAVRDLARQTWSVVLPGAAGATRISAGVVARVAELATLRVDGVRAAWVRLAPGAQVVVHLSLVVEHGVRIPLLARAARTAVRRDLAALTAVVDARVDVHVDDVDPPRVERRA